MSRRLSAIGRDLQWRVRKFFDAPLDAAATPLEIRQAVLDDVERRIEPLGGGRRVLPYTRLTIRVRHTAVDRAPLECIFAEMDLRIRERLAEVRCDPPRALDVNVVYLPDAPPGWTPDQLFAVDYAREPHSSGPKAAAAAAPGVQLTVLKGASTERTYTFADATISIGRSTDATDDLGRVRRNRVAFLDTVDGVTETVGRAHARLHFDATAGEYRLFDDGSSNGTSIVRGATTITVPRRDPRGVRVLSGDELLVGRAVIRVTLVG